MIMIISPGNIRHVIAHAYPQTYIKLSRSAFYHTGCSMFSLTIPFSLLFPLISCLFSINNIVFVCVIFVAFPGGHYNSLRPGLHHSIFKKLLKFCKKTVLLYEKIHTLFQTVIDTFKYIYDI